MKKLKKIKLKGFNLLLMTYFKSSNHLFLNYLSIYQLKDKNNNYFFIYFLLCLCSCLFNYCKININESLVE